jgi:hypothetical protein
MLHIHSTSPSEFPIAMLRNVASLPPPHLRQSALIRTGTQPAIRACTHTVGTYLELS